MAPHSGATIVSAGHRPVFLSLGGTSRVGQTTRMHTDNSVLLHLVFGTRGHLPFLAAPEFRNEVHADLAGICRNLGCEPYAIGGWVDHVHGLLRLKATVPAADLLEKLKGSSSKWIHESHPDMRTFAWQRGYGAFSVSYSSLSRVRRYIERQEEHHRARSFREELETLLGRHEVAVHDDDLTR